MLNLKQENRMDNLLNLTYIKTIGNMFKYGGAAMGLMGILNGHDGASDFYSVAPAVFGGVFYIGGHLINDVIDCLGKES